MIAGATGHGGGGAAGPRLPASLRLIVILDDAAAAGRDLAGLATAVVKGGATMIQVRAKGMPPGPLAETTRRVIGASGGVPVLVNDRLDVALATGAAGCHLGQADLPIADARLMAPAGFVLGGSAGSPEEALRAAAAGAHYLGIGPIHVTSNKADAGEAIGVEGFARIRAATRLPCVAIGGVTAGDIPALRAAGADGIAVIGAVLGTGDDVEAAARALKTVLEA